MVVGVGTRKGKGQLGTGTFLSCVVARSPDVTFRTGRSGGEDQNRSRKGRSTVQKCQMDRTVVNHPQECPQVRLFVERFLRGSDWTEGDGSRGA